MAVSRKEANNIMAQASPSPLCDGNVPTRRSGFALEGTEKSAGKTGRETRGRSRRYQPDVHTISGYDSPGLHT